MSDKIIECSQEMERRFTERRRSDIGVHEKARRFDEIVTQSKLYFDIFQAKHKEAVEFGDVAMARRCVALSHEHWHILQLAGVDLVCDCDYCKVSRELINEKPEALK